MGGYGSGRFGRKARCDDFKSLDANWLNRQGYLKAGTDCTVHWWRGGERIGWIGMQAEANKVVLTYRVRQGGADWRDVIEPVPVLWSPCPYGGARPWFRCPGVVRGRECGRRVVKLYAAGRWFLCRHCYGLAYDSQKERPMQRRLARANRLRRKLGGAAGMANPIAKRPKGMWRRTYRRIVAGIDRAEAEADAIFAADAGRLLARLGLEV